MPKYALLGATGSTGSAIIRHLLANAPSDDLTLNIFVRSKSKLAKAFPDLQGTASFKTVLFEGIPSDTATLRECLRDVDVVLGCIGTNEPTSGMTLIYDTATSIIEALRQHQKQSGSAYKTPTVIQLRSSSLNPYAAMPWVARNMAWFMLYHIYKDLDRACELYSKTAKDEPGLLSYIFVDPPSIHDADGTTPTGYRLFLDVAKEKQEPAISYADLGAAFCEVAERREEFVGKGVFVSATGAVNMTWGPLMGYMAKGLKTRIIG